MSRVTEPSGFLLVDALVALAIGAAVLTFGTSQLGFQAQRLRGEESRLREERALQAAKDSVMGMTLVSGVRSGVEGGMQWTVAASAYVDAAAPADSAGLGLLSVVAAVTGVRDGSAVRRRRYLSMGVETP